MLRQALPVGLRERPAFQAHLTALAPLLQAWREGQAHEADALFALLRAVPVPETLRRAAFIRASAQRVLVIGMGASSLAGETLAVLADGAGPTLHFLDNIDPHTVAQKCAIHDATTHIIAVSKSGATPETLALCQVFLALPAERPASERFTFIAEPGDTKLHRLAREHHVPVLPHPPVSGRFAGLGLAGVLPAAVAGADVAALSRGAAAALAETIRAQEESLPALGAAFHAIFAPSRPISVLWAYADRLRPFLRWHQQLWGESLGKAGKGTTPLAAIGAVDQHSQLQLYLEGPHDKIATFLLLPQAGAGAKVPDAHYHIGDVFEAEQQATRHVMAKRLPTRCLTLPRLDAFTLGALMTQMMLETLLTAHLWQVTPFDQPAVEAGKARARAILAALPGACA